MLMLYTTFETASQTTTDISLVGLHRTSYLNRFGLRARIEVLLVTQEAFHNIESRLSTKKSNHTTAAHCQQMIVQQRKMCEMKMHLTN